MEPTFFWGASAIPFTERELDGWPISSAELAEYYQNIAEDIGVAGATDDLTRYFGREFVTRPLVPPIPLARHLADQISRSAGGYTFFAGNNRLAIETRLDKDNRCIRCGACMTGCGAGSIYSARTDITRHIAEGRLNKIVNGTVQSIDLLRRAIRLNEAPDSHSFDRIYIAAGCIGSTEVILRSVGLKVSPVMYDNVTFTFPIFYFGDAITDTEPKRYFGLSNTADICAPQTGSAPASFIQIYPLFDHLWRYFIPVAFWPAFAPVVARLRGRVLIARLYLHSSFGTTYVFRMLDHSSIELTRVGEAGTLDRASDLWQAIRAAVAGSGFFIPPLRPIRQTTNSHYSGSLPLGGELVTRDGCLADGIYLCDAANFVDGPALSPTFTIMANAARIAHRSI